MGITTRNNDILRESVNTLLEREINPTVINGLFGIYFTEIKLEKDIKAVAHMLGLDSQFTVELIELLNKNTDNTYINALNICQSSCNEAKLASSIVAVV